MFSTRATYLLKDFYPRSSPPPPVLSGKHLYMQALFSGPEIGLFNAISSSDGTNERELENELVYVLYVRAGE